VEGPVLADVFVKGFRCFEDLHVSGLTRVSLLVGRNNAGKTSVLEAIEALQLAGPTALMRGPRRRGEETQLVLPDSSVTTEIDISHLFYGHALAPGATFSISSSSGPHMRCVVVDMPDEGLIDSEIGTDASGPRQGALGVELETHAASSRRFQLSPEGGVSLALWRRLVLPTSEAGNVHFVGTDPIEPLHLSRIWDSLVLTAEEEHVTDALRLIEPDIERIAFMPSVRRGRGSFVVKLGKPDQRVPIGSVGDGLRRLLTLALHLVPARGGTLLLDEIDTGLHHSVMVRMWRLVIETAQRLDIQVIATTHSLDCIEALATCVRESGAEDVSAHRIEHGRPTAVTYSGNELTLAAKHQIEVR
jgi:hypothetical protein